MSSYSVILLHPCKYILDTNTLLDKCFANIFSQSVACLFILLKVSFIEKLYISHKLCFLFLDIKIYH